MFSGNLDLIRQALSENPSCDRQESARNSQLEIGQGCRIRALDVGGDLALGILIAERQTGGQVFLHQAVQDGALGRAAAINMGGGSP